MIRARSLTRAVPIESLETRWHLSAVLINNLNQDTAPSNPTGYVDVNGTAVFFAENAANGLELWRSTGSEFGTSLLRDIYPGPAGAFSSTASSSFTIVGSKAFFFASDDTHGRELWVTDGTSDGTSLVADLSPGVTDGVQGKIVPAADGRVLFVASGGKDIWSSDGNAAGTYKVVDSAATAGVLKSISSPVSLSNGIAFVAEASFGGTPVFDLYFSGSSAGSFAQRLGASDFAPGAITASTTLVTNGNQVYFTQRTPSGTEVLWRTDVATFGTEIIADTAGTFGDLTPYDDGLFFTALRPFGPNARTLWRTDGFSQATVVNNELTDPRDLKVVGDSLYLSAVSDFVGREPWAINLTWNPGYSTMLADTVPGSASGIETLDVFSFNGVTHLVTRASAAGNFTLWETDGSDWGTNKVVQPTQGYDVAPAGDSIYFTRGVSGAGSDVWHIVDTGFSYAPQPVKSILGPSKDGILGPVAAVNSRLIYAGTSGVNDGNELYQNPGFYIGYQAVREEPAAASGIAANTAMFSWQGRVYYNGGAANPGLWATDGTTAGTVKIANAPAAREFVASGDYLYFITATSPAWWRTDGTTAGTVAVANFAIPSAGNPPVATDRTLFIPAGGLLQAVDSGTTTSRTVMNFGTGRTPTLLTADGSRLFFAVPADASGAVSQLYVSNGTSAGTIALTTGSGVVTAITAGDGRAYFIRRSGSLSELWITDGTAVGTRKITQAGQSVSGALGVNGNTAYFTGDNGRLWKSDGTAIGTEQLVDIQPAPPTATSGPIYFSVGATMYFVGSTPQTGMEVFSTQGTPQTTNLHEAVPGPAGSSPRLLEATDYSMLFSATRPDTGRELWADQYQILQNSVVGGTAFNDTDRDGILDPGETPRPSVRIYLDRNNNKVFDFPTDDSAVTDAFGRWGISTLGTGNFVVRESLTNGWVATSPAALNADVDAGEQLTSVNFGAYNTGASARGVVWSDENRNGVMDAGEPKVGGAIVYVDSDLDGNYDAGELQAGTLADGTYQLANLYQFNYRIRVMIPPGRAITAPAAGFTDVAITAPTQQVTNINFGLAPAIAGQPVTLRAAADLYVRDGTYAATNFGNATELQLKKSSSAGSTRESYLRFNLSEIASVGTVKLRLFGKIDHATQTAQVAMYPVSDTIWSESSFNWDNRRAVGTDVIGTQTIASATGKWYEWDLTSYVAAQRAKGAKDISVCLRSLTATDPYLIFNSDEAATNMPQLVVSPPVAPLPQELVISPANVEVPEGSKSSFSVRLATQPTANVSVSITRTSGDSDLTVGTSSTLTFTPSNWSTNQNVFISAADDVDATNGSATFMVSSADVASKTVTATEADNDVVTPPTGGTVTIRSISDSYVRDGSYATQNFGTATQIVVKKHSYAGNTRESYLRFTLGDVGSASVTGGKLRIFAKSNSSSEAVTLSLSAFIGGSWSETGVNWNNKPAGTTTLPGTQVVSGTTGKWYEFDVTSIVQQAKNAGSDLTFILKGLAQTEAQALIESDETATTTSRPQLVVTTGTPPPPVQELVVSPATLSVAEGSTNSFAVKLAIAPTSNVVVNIVRASGDTDLSTGTSSLTFTPANWNVAQSVVLSAAQDADTTNGSASFSISSTGLSSKSVTATEIDNDVPAAPVTLRATADAYVRDGSSAAANFGSATELQLKKSSSAGSTRDFYLKFDLTSAASIGAAKLRLNGKIDHATQTAQVAIYSVSDTTWGESTLNWNNRPQVAVNATPVGAAKTIATSTAKYYEWDLTSFLAAEKAAGRNLVTLVVRSLTATDPYLIFSSDEAASNRPELAITP